MLSVKPDPRTVPWAAYACLGASMALVGSYVGLSKLLLAVFPVLLLAWLRFGIAALAMLHWLPRRAGDLPFSQRDRVLLFLQSLLGNVLFSICMLYGVLWSSALAAGIVMAAIPAAVALLSRLFLHERIPARTALAIACACAGIALLAWARAWDASPSLAPHHLMGHALLLAAVFCEASYVVIGKRLATQASPRRVTAWINLWGLALLTPWGLWQAASHDFHTVPLASWVLLLFYALAASVVTVWLWMRGLRDVPAARAGVFTALLPLAAAAVGVAVLREPFGMAHAAAFALTFGGLLLATWPAAASAGAPR